MTSPAADVPRRRWTLVPQLFGLTFCWLVVYTLLVAYDVRVWTVAPSAWHYVHLPVDPTILEMVPQPVPQTAREIEAYVKRLVPWTADWQVYGLPWYFPTPREAVAARRGDCEAEAVVLASLLAARGLPYQFRASFSHLWVDYPGRAERRGERVAEAIWQNVDGRYQAQWPALPELRANFLNQKELLWDHLALWRRVLLLLGWPAIIIGVPRRRLRAGRAESDE